jgi:hypothetical protein
MIHANIELHNAVELEAAAGGGLHLLEGRDILTDYVGITTDLIHLGDYIKNFLQNNIFASL